MVQKVILLGKPNVGKSSLFNRLAGARLAITSDVSGTTRDYKRTIINLEKNQCELIDSGGLDESDDFFKTIKKSSLKLANDADIILYMLDAKFMPSDDDRAMIYEISKLKKKLALVVNKCDSKKDKERAYEYYNFGIKDIFFISVSHNSSIDDIVYFLDDNLKQELKMDEDLSLEDFLQPQESIVKIGIVGRVNTGKSSLLNALVDKQRSIVSSIAGTTIDPVNEIYEYNDRKFEFVDTAGIRKRGKIEGIERYALNRTEKILEKSDIALLILDASENLTELDERIAGLASKFELGLIIVLNKWDKARADFKEISAEIRDKFKFLSYAPIISVSALSNKRIHKIYDLIVSVYEKFSQKIQTSKLNDIIIKATQNHPLPHDKGKSVKIYYAAQFSTKPPKIALVMNRPKALHFSYKRYLINKIRENYDFTGSPLLLFARAKGANEKNEE